MAIKMKMVLKHGNAELQRGGNMAACSAGYLDYTSAFPSVTRALCTHSVSVLGTLVQIYCECNFSGFVWWYPDDSINHA